MTDDIQERMNSESDDRIERLICRTLDGEATSAEQAELDQALNRSVMVRERYGEYRLIDSVSAAALRADVNSSASMIHRPYRAVWITAATAVLAAAAVVALSFLPIFDRSESIARNEPRTQPPLLAPNAQPAPWVDYRNVDCQPRQRMENVFRDVIGVRSDDPNVIFIFERGTQSTQVVPVSGDF